MNSEQLIERFHQVLRSYFRTAGFGTVKRVEEQLEVCAGYFRDQRRPDRLRLDLKVLFRALETLGIEADQFLSIVFGASDPVTNFKAQASILRRQMKRLPAILNGIEGRTDQRKSGPVDLESLDALRDESPQAVMRRACTLVHTIPDEQLPELLGIYASACRSAGFFARAQVVLSEALEIASHRDDLPSEGNLLLRCASILGDEARYEEALVIAEAATLSYFLCGDLLGVGKSLLKQGSALGCLERREEEVRQFKSALGFLKEIEGVDAERNKFACLMNLATASRKMNDLDNAETYAQEAFSMASRIGKNPNGKVAWFLGSVARQRGELGKAEEHFRNAFEILRTIAPLTSALIAVDLVRIQLLRGHTSEAYRTAKATAALVKPLEPNPIAAAAVIELVRCAITGQGLTARFLNQVAQGLAADRVQSKQR